MLSATNFKSPQGTLNMDGEQMAALCPPLAGLGGPGAAVWAVFWEEQGPAVLMTHMFVTRVSTSVLCVYFPSVTPSCSEVPLF